MKLKKLAALLMASAIVAGSIAGCGNSTSDSKADNAQAAATDGETAKEESKEETSGGSGGKQFEGVTLTIWPSNGIYGNKNSENVEAIQTFLEWYSFEEGMDTLTSFYTPAGGFHTGYEPKGKTLDLIKDVQAYYTQGNTALALEYLTPIKGANCPQICSEFGSGQTSAREAAEAYDKDCKKTAMQLRIWNFISA